VKIGQVASAAGVSIDTVRFYERRGVLPPAPRTASGYRVFPESAVTRITVARRLQQLGLTLDEIAGALHAQEAGPAACESERWRLHAALDRIEARIADLIRIRGDVCATLAACEAGSCPVLAGLAG
jgi:DNA-binding transcriptional MerR regulator